MSAADWGLALSQGCCVLLVVLLAAAMAATWRNLRGPRP